LRRPDAAGVEAHGGNEVNALEDISAGAAGNNGDSVGPNFSGYSVGSALQSPAHDNSEDMWTRYFAPRQVSLSLVSAVHIARSIYHGPLFAKRIRRLGGPARSYLEIGVGSGETLKELQRATGADCYGVDKTSVACRLAKKNAQRCRIVASDGLLLPFIDASFDVVYSLGLLEHFEDGEQRSLLREHARVAKRAVLLHLPAHVPHLRLLLWLNRTFWGRSGVWADEELFTTGLFRQKFPDLPFRSFFDVAAGAMSYWFVLKPEDVLRRFVLLR
jgi:SAM-dependent methyltransferase